MIQGQHGVGLATAEVRLEVNNGIASFTCEAADGPNQQSLQQDFEAVAKLASVTELLIGEGQQTPVSIAFFTYSCA